MNPKRQRIGNYGPMEIQTLFMSRCMKENTQVIIECADGIGYECFIKAFDMYTVLIEVTQTYGKHAANTSALRQVLLFKSNIISITPVNTDISPINIKRLIADKELQTKGDLIDE